MEAVRAPSDSSRGLDVGLNVSLDVGISVGLGVAVRDLADDVSREAVVDRDRPRVSHRDISVWRERDLLSLEAAAIGTRDLRDLRVGQCALILDTASAQAASKSDATRRRIIVLRECRTAMSDPFFVPTLLAILALWPGVPKQMLDNRIESETRRSSGRVTT